MGVQCCNTFSPIFSRPRLVQHALSIPGVHVPHCNNPLMDVKKMNTELNQAMDGSYTIPSDERPTYLTAVPW